MSQSRASDIIAATALADRSFAGPYAYSDSAPFKVLAGTQKSVPIEYVIEALDEIQAGQGAHHSESMKGVLKPTMPEKDRLCNELFDACRLIGDFSTCHAALDQCMASK